MAYSLIMRFLPLFLTITSVAFGQAALRAGAARIDITPAQASGLKNVWGNEFKGVHDHIYIRAIVLDNGATSAALIALDTSSRTPCLCGSACKRNSTFRRRTS